MRRAAFIVFLLGVAAPTGASAQLKLLDEEQRLKSKQPPNVSTDLMDPMAVTRLHLTTRGTFSTPGQEAFGDDSLWTVDLQTFIRVRPGVAVQFALPFGVLSPAVGNNEFVFGNIRAGAAGGLEVRLQPGKRESRSARFKIGGGIDVYLPTTSAPDGPLFLRQAYVAAVRALHPFEPELFVEDAMFFRFRTHAQLSFDYLIMEAELGLSPGFTTVGDSETLFLAAWAGRVSIKPFYWFDPYVEASSSFHVVGQTDSDLLNGSLGRDYTTSVWITPGVRFHFWAVDPAFFVSFNMDEFAVMFGIDLAGAAREYVRIQDNDNFMDVY